MEMASHISIQDRTAEILLHKTRVDFNPMWGCNSKFNLTSLQDDGHSKALTLGELEALHDIV